jgi:hypothetical protein
MILPLVVVEMAQYIEYLRIMTPSSQRVLITSIEIIFLERSNVREDVSE